MKKIFFTAIVVVLVAPFLSLVTKVENTPSCSLKVGVTDLRNSIGNVQFTLYNKDGSIPDETYENYYLQKTSTIENGRAYVVFKNIPQGKYAVNILHDENKDGKIKKGWILPVEGIGFSNYTTINLFNRPNFNDASFILKADAYKKVNIIYM